MQTPALLKEWEPQHFDQIQNEITRHFNSITFTTQKGINTQHKKQQRTFDQIDTILGLAYTSTGKWAGYWVCNCELYADPTGEFKIQGFAIGEDGNIYAEMSDREETGKITLLTDANGNLTPAQRLLYNLKKCAIDGHNVKLPTGARLSRDEYTEVKKHLELIGGKWTGGKTQAFVFQEDPTKYMYALQHGEKVNLKKEFQFFGTPEGLADRLIELAEVRPNHDILEPSAGQGAIVKAIKKELGAGFNVYGYELMPLNQKFLENITGFVLLGEDFLTHTETKYDRIIANPPFSKNADITHIQKMFDCLKPGGRIVTVASNHWRNTSGKKETAFKNWLEELNVEPIDVEAGEFKESGTTIATCILVIDKPIETTGKKTTQQPTLF